MTPTKSVLGVSGVCWVDFKYPTQFQVFYFAAFSLVCWVCWVWRRARAWAMLFEPTAARFFSYARTVKPNTPNTLNTSDLKLLILKVFSCVGFVLGVAFFVSGSVLGGGAV
ncbi:hypothetical protein [Pseudomonas sp. TB1-B1]|uniref:hypothetical protein n=1 Tax=Pseudomonas sp. TB1-B1 TaxID=2985515 RepID=UPI0022708D54|nr:hypothetical protein [Pseudomonas sp. TB1-B1]MCX9150584.1 hypothetical protein [Pseudomonas sp. TB1-B1]